MSTTYDASVCWVKIKDKICPWEEHNFKSHAVSAWSDMKVQKLIENAGNAKANEI